MSIKDPLQELTDVLTLFRNDLKDLQRTSLNRDEALALNESLMGSVSQMMKVGPDTQKAIENSLSTVASVVQVRTTKAAEIAARDAILKSHAENRAAAMSFSQAAGEARRQAWRYFGGFWVWLASMLATGAALGLLLAYGMETVKSALSVDDLVRYNCGRSWFGGQVVDQDNGSSFCAFWIRPAPE